jgi:exopolysaccharide production protein ExoQ
MNSTNLGLKRAQPPSGTAATGIWSGDRPGSKFTTFLLILLFGIMILPQGLDYTGSTTSMPTSGDSSSRAVWLILLFGGIYLLARYSARTLVFIKSLNPFLILFMALATISTIWSIDPGVTIRRVIRIWTIVPVCAAFVLVGWHPRRFQNVLRTLLTCVMIASVIFVYVNPALAVHSPLASAELANAWHGITTGKNLFGSLAGACLVLWLHAWLSKQASFLSIVFGVALSATCLIKSRSSASMMATIFAVVFMLLLLRSPGSLRRYMPAFVTLFGALVVTYILAVLHLVPGLDFILQPIVMFSGKDLTFTGRTNIWYILQLHIRLRPLLGSGYGAYWVGPQPSSPSYAMLQWLYFYPNEGHNGYLDMVNDLGLVGGGCLFAYLGSYLRSALYLTLLFRGLLADMSESHWFSVLSVDFVVMTLATTALARSLLQAGLDAAAGRRKPRSQPARQSAV